ncbi:MAG: oligosaccharide flippase family protein [Methanobacterium sp.]|nr:oligosaccharide flippase family protein [Methanobacterium sp.]
MDLTIPRNLKEFKSHLQDPLYRNSFYILLTLISGAIFGFIFWIIAARVYNQQEVGLNTALISVVGLIAIISFLGLDQSIIRFFPERNKFTMLTTSSIVIMIATILFGIIFILGIDMWSPDLVLIKNNLFAFFISLVAFSLTTPTANAFIAYRKSKYYLFQSLLMNLRVLLVLLPFLGTLGIFFSFGISSVIAIIFSFIILYRIIEKSSDERILRIDKNFLRESLHFSAGNYFFSLFITIPIYLLPILVLNVLGSNQTAYYYIAYTIASFLFMVSAAFSTSLFVEGSHGESLRKNTIKSLLAIFSILVPLALFIFVFGGYILGLFGKDYTEGLELLRVMIISSFFYSICQVYFSIEKVRKNIKDLIIISFLIFALLVGLSYFLMVKFGILGVGYAWIISYFLGSLFVMFKMLKL